MLLLVTLYENVGQSLAAYSFSLFQSTRSLDWNQSYCSICHQRGHQRRSSFLIGVIWIVSLLWLNNASVGIPLACFHFFSSSETPWRRQTAWKKRVKRWVTLVELMVGKERCKDRCARWFFVSFTNFVYFKAIEKDEREYWRSIMA